MATALGVSTVSYLPFLWFNFLALIISLIYGYRNLFIWYTHPEAAPTAKQPISSKKGNSLEPKEVHTQNS